MRSDLRLPVQAVGQMRSCVWEKGHGDPGVLMDWQYGLTILLTHCVFAPLAHLSGTSMNVLESNVLWRFHFGKGTHSHASSIGCMCPDTRLHVHTYVSDRGPSVQFVVLLCKTLCLSSDPG